MLRHHLVSALGASVLLGMVVYFSATNPTTELMQLDGIELAPNAVSQLTSNGGQSNEPSYVHLSHESGKRINRLLKKDEKGEIDGIALDSRAEAELGDSQESAQPRQSHARSHKNAHVSRAQTLLDEGKQDLDSSNWQDAVKLFSKAEAIWKRHGNDDYHWAASLKNDVMRAHPELAAQQSSSHAMSEHQREVKDAEKQLASGHAFRSLYALLRERQAAKLQGGGLRSGPSPSSSAMTSKTATASLAQPADAPPSSVAQKIDAATKAAIQTLEQQNKALLKREEAAILFKAEEEKRRAMARQQHRAHRRQLRLAAAAKAPQAAPALASWQSAQGPSPSVALSFRSAGQGQRSAWAQAAPAREEALAEVPAAMAAPPSPQYAQAQPAVQQSLAGGAPLHPEKQAVPVINLNLPPGQVVPAGQYEMDGNLVEDATGHWNFVGDLLPRGGQEVAS